MVAGQITILVMCVVYFDHGVHSYTFSSLFARTRTSEIKCRSTVVGLITDVVVVPLKLLLCIVVDRSRYSRNGQLFFLIIDHFKIKSHNAITHCSTFSEIIGYISCNFKYVVSRRILVNVSQ